MEAEDVKMFLENIEEFVMDEEKIVTYKWLSSTLNLHVNTAKQLLYLYAMPNGKVKSRVHMTYLVGGTLLDESGVKFQIVREQDLGRVKSQFKVVSSEHVYSVQKANTLPDLNILFAIDNLKNDYQNADKLGPIRCTNARQRLDNVITSLKTKAQAVANNPALNGKKNQSIAAQPDSNSTSKLKTAPEPTSISVSPVVSITPEEVETIAVSEPKSSDDSPTIASMFTAQAKTSNITSKVGATAKPPSKKPAKGGIAMFFTKQVEKPKHSETSGVAPLKEVKPISVANCTTSKSNPVVLDKGKTVLIKKVNQPQDAKPDLETNLKKTGKTFRKEKFNSEKKSIDGVVIGKHSCTGKGKKVKPGNELPAKRRKRILVISDDSSSDGDIFGKEESDTEIPPPSPDRFGEKIPESPSSDENVIPATPAAEQVRNGKTRKRKLVGKTFEGKDGFLMTKKEFVFESCSEDEGDINELVKETLANDVKSKGQDGETNGKVKNTDPIVVKDKTTKNNLESEKQSKKKKASPPAAHKNKQSSIMSFFNKN